MSWPESISCVQDLRLAVLMRWPLPLWTLVPHDVLTDLSRGFLGLMVLGGARALRLLLLPTPYFASEILLSFAPL